LSHLVDPVRPEVPDLLLQALAIPQTGSETYERTDIVRFANLYAD
jgi:hypothetical protein